MVTEPLLYPVVSGICNNYPNPVRVTNTVVQDINSVVGPDDVPGRHRDRTGPFQWCLRLYLSIGDNFTIEQTKDRKKTRNTKMSQLRYNIYINAHIHTHIKLNITVLVKIRSNL